MADLPPLRISKRRLISSQTQNSTLRRQTSVTGRVVSRMWNTIHSRPKSSQGTRESSGLSSLSTYRSSSDLQRDNSSNVLSSPSTPRTSYDYDSVIFPELEVPPLKVGVKVTPELDKVAREEERTLWVAVEATGILKELDLSSTTIPLDIAIIFDTSVFASKLCLDHSRNIILQLSKLLVNDNDRIAIFCTAIQHELYQDTITSCQLYPLSKPKPAKIAELLHLVSNCRPWVSPKELDLAETLAAAIRLFDPPISKRIGGNGHNRHILVISPNPVECCGTLPTLSSTPVHLMQPGIVHWNSATVGSISWNIWASIQDAPDKPLDAPSDLLQHFVNHARANILPQSVRDLKIKVEPSPGVEITKVLGLQHYPIFHPGEVAFVMVSAKVPKCTRPKKRLGQPKSDVLFSDLDYFLGEMELFHTTVSYCDQSQSRKSSFVSKSCHVARPNPKSAWSVTAAEKSYVEQRVLEIDLYKRVIYAIANTFAPKQALWILATLVCDQDTYPELIAYLASVRTDLDHQITVAESFDIDIPQETTQPYFEYPKPCESPLKDLEVAPLEINIRSSAQGTPSSTKTMIHRKEASNEGKDAARQIWQQMRQSSKSKQDLNVEDPRRVVSDESFMTIQERALKNKRSIGLDTLRSLSLQSQEASEDAHAPWL